MTFNGNELQLATEESNKKRILEADIYDKVCGFINGHGGLPIDCEMDLRDNFPDIYRSTLRAILETEENFNKRSFHFRYEASVEKYWEKYEILSKSSPSDSSILLNIARIERIGPVMMCRIMLKFKYKLNKIMLSKMMRYPHLIEEPLLSANVAQCLCSDSQDGPLIDMRRRALGEEYEYKLKHMAKEAGMHFYDENDLRRLGYDKTPDIKMILPFLFKGEVINWIESKANFGDIKTHKRYIRQQLTSYCNRFGAGIIIYWFGYHENTPKLPDNSIGVVVLDDFPSQIDIELLDISEKIETEDIKVTEET